MKLLNGITGFYDSKYNQPPKMDSKKLKKLCFTIMKQNEGEVLGFKEPKYPSNFYDVETNVFNNKLHILLNEHYPFMAFATKAEFGNIVFIDEPKLFIQFSPFYNVLDSKKLNEPLHLNLSSKKSVLQNDNELNSAELKQIAYWKPERIGEVIFNYWD